MINSRKSAILNKMILILSIFSTAFSPRSSDLIKTDYEDFVYMKLRKEFNDAVQANIARIEDEEEREKAKPEDIVRKILDESRHINSLEHIRRVEIESEEEKKFNKILRQSSSSKRKIFQWFQDREEEGEKIKEMIEYRRNKTISNFRDELRASDEFKQLEKTLSKLYDGHSAVLREKLFELCPCLYVIEDPNHVQKINDLINILKRRILNMTAQEENAIYFLDFSNDKDCSDKLRHCLKAIDLSVIKNTILENIISKIKNPDSTLNPEAQAYIDKLTQIITATQNAYSRYQRLKNLYTYASSTVGLSV